MISPTEQVNFECVVCQNDYDNASRKPMNLNACGHSVCNECLVEKISKKVGETLSAQCPLCRKVSVTDKFVVNFPFLAVLPGAAAEKVVSAVGTLMPPSAGRVAWDPGLGVNMIVAPSPASISGGPSIKQKQELSAPSPVAADGSIRQKQELRDLESMLMLNMTSSACIHINALCELPPETPAHEIFGQLRRRSQGNDWNGYAVNVNQALKNANFDPSVRDELKGYIKRYNLKQGNGCS